MGIGKGWVDLDGPSIALHSTTNVLHFFQSVTHITVCICKAWMDPGKS